MEYNTLRSKLIMPEYGRHIHLMVQHAISLKDRDQRNLAAQTIIGVMGSLMPHLREIPDFRHKLWDHLFIISDFKLDIDAPYPPPLHNAMYEKPALISYPQTRIRQKHYGKILVKMISEAAEMEDSPQKTNLIQAIATQMKKSYTAWNRSEINNEQLVLDIRDISERKIDLKPEQLQLADIPASRETSSQSSHGHQGKNKKKRFGGSGRK